MVPFTELLVRQSVYIFLDANLNFQLAEELQMRRGQINVFTYIF